MKPNCYLEMLKKEHHIILSNVGLKTYNKIMDALELTYKDSFTKTIEELTEMKKLLESYVFLYSNTHSEIYISFIFGNQSSNIDFTLSELSKKGD